MTIFNEETFSLKSGLQKGQNFRIYKQGDCIFYQQSRFDVILAFGEQQFCLDSF